MNANTELPKALSVFFEQYSQEQQSRLRLTLIAELQRMRLELEQYESSDSIEGLKHQFTGIARYLQLKDMLSVMDVCERDLFEYQLCSLLKAVMDYANEH